MSTVEILDKMISSDKELYERILETPGFAFYFNELTKNALSTEKPKQEEMDKFAIDFANWVEGLKPNQKVSVWSKSGEHRGLFTMDNEQLLDSYKRKLNRKKR